MRKDVPSYALHPEKRDKSLFTIHWREAKFRNILKVFQTRNFKTRYFISKDVEIIFMFFQINKGKGRVTALRIILWE